MVERKSEKEKWIPAALRGKTWQAWLPWHWEVRGREEHDDSKLLVWADGRMVAPFAELSWGLGKFGGGGGEFWFTYVEGEESGGL
jgi:hypothetical protein